MSIFSGVVVFALIWWMAFFCLLPVKIETINHPTDGSMPGAPISHGLKWKFLIATVVACVLWVVAYFVITSDLVSFRAMAAKMRM